MSEPHVEVSISVREWDVGARRQLSRRTFSINADSAISLGRAADVAVAVEPPDVGVSRHALTVSWSGEWRIHLANRNGAFVHPWGQAPALVDAGTSIDLPWPRVGVRLIGWERAIEHWVLLESTAAAPRDRRASSVPGPTKLPDFPKPLTLMQTAAVRAVFRDFLAWPPVSGAVPVPLAAAANRLGISPAALQERLSRVQDRAYAVGLHQLIGVSDPGYVHLLVRLGYIQPASPTLAPRSAAPTNSTVLGAGRTGDDPYNLSRFVIAQDTGGTYDAALAELGRGRKTSHWMWFVFPQIAGLGQSSISRKYALASLDEARAYLRHPVLGPRLLESARMVGQILGRTPEQIFGGIDAQKLRSSMTLFHLAGPDESVFRDVLDRFFQGRLDPATESRLPG